MESIGSHSKSTRIQLGRWSSVLLVATLASGLPTYIFCSGRLFVQTAQESPESMWPTEQYESPGAGGGGGGSGGNRDDLVEYHGGKVLLSNEFYLLHLSKEPGSQPPAAVHNSEGQPSGAHQISAAAPITNTNDTTTTTNSSSIRDQTNKTACQPLAEINHPNGSMNDDNRPNNCTANTPATNESTSQPTTATNVTKLAAAGSRIENNPLKNSNNSSSGNRNNYNKFYSTETPYCLGTKNSEFSFNWLCQGTDLVRVPVELPEPMSLRLSNTGIETLTSNSFPNYRDTLRDFSMENAPKLLAIEEGTFAELTKLRVVYIFQAPKLVSFDFALSGLHPDLTIIHIQQTGLRHWPNLSRFKQERILNSLDLDNNRITTLSPQPINIRTELLNLGFNLISSIDEFTFNGSEIGTLSLSGNGKLSFIHPNAFANLKNLMKLDLSSTSVAQLPPVGLHQLRTLIIRDTYTLKKIPSIYVFPKLETAHLTYAYHCCSFKYPQTHDPSAYEEHLRLQAELNVLCGNRKDTGAINQEAEDSFQQQQNATSSDDKNTYKQKQSYTPTSGQTSTQAPQNSDFEGYFEMDQKMVGAGEDTMTMTQQPIGLIMQTAQPSNKQPNNNSNSNNNNKPTLQSKQQAPELMAAAGKSSVAGPPSSTVGIHQSSLNQWLMHNIECGELAVKYTTFPSITCTPEPDAFNPCEDIMGYPVLRVAVWFVVGAAVFGNLSVIVVLMGVFRRLSVPKFLQLNLAIGDLFMGIYLAMLAMADVTTVGSYFNFAIDWQHGYGCKVAGAASLFASQLSIFTLCVITFERYYTITYSIDLNMRLQLGWASRIMFLGWLFAFASAMLPIFADISSYSKTSICLPMRTGELMDRIFLAVLLIIDSSAFVIIFACYLRMYLLIIRQKTEATAKERKIAMRMALLVFTDFVCWAPIIFFGATALLGTPLISVTNSKILIVFFYPLNSMANPFLYVISTRQYRRDLNYLTSRWHVWRKNLFNRNNDSYYSQNAAYGVAQYPGNPLNAHMGAVAALAAVTGVAQHHQPINLNGLNLKEQRVVCTKSHKGRYIIRHQILTDAQLPGDPRGGNLGAARGGNQACHLMNGRRGATQQALLARQARGVDRQQVAVAVVKRGPPEVDTCTGSGCCMQHSEVGQLGQASCASKLVNVSTNGKTMTDDSTGSLSNDRLKAAAVAGCCELKPDCKSKQSTCTTGKKKSSHGDQQHHHKGTKFAHNDSRLVERTCNCCCRCYRWSGISPNVQTDETSLEAPRHLESSQKSVTMLTSLPNNQGGTTEQPTSATATMLENMDLEKKQDDKTTKARPILGPRCSCPLVEDMQGFQNLDDIFRGSLLSGGAEEDQLKCEAHNTSDQTYRAEETGTGSNYTSPEGGADPIDILGNISYNEPTSSPSGISSPPISNQTASEHSHQHHRQPEAGGSQNHQEHLIIANCCSTADNHKCWRRRRCKCCSRQYYTCDGYIERREKPIKGQLKADGSLENNPATGGDKNPFPAPEDFNPSSDQSSDKHSGCHHHRHHNHNHHHSRNRNCNCNRSRYQNHHHHNHHHQRHHHNHNSHDHCHHSTQTNHQPDDDRQDVARSALQKGYADGEDDLLMEDRREVQEEEQQQHHDDELIDFSPAAMDPNDLLSRGSSVATGGETHRQLESILKSNKSSANPTQSGSGRGRGSGRWSPIVSLFRGGSFQSSTMRAKEKKRVSIVDHHSG